MPKKIKEELAIETKTCPECHGRGLKTVKPKTASTEVYGNTDPAAQQTGGQQIENGTQIQVIECPKCQGTGKIQSVEPDEESLMESKAMTKQELVQTIKELIKEVLAQTKKPYPKAFTGNELGANEKKCKHCKQYFDELGLSCTATKYGECNCPICQGFCQCGEESEDEINETSLNEGGNYGWKSQIRGFTKEYVLTSDNVDEPAAAVVYKRTDGSGKWTAKIYRNNHLEMVNHFMSEREAKNWAGDWIGVYPGLSEAADKKESPRQATQRRFRQYAGEPRKTKDNETPKERMQRRLKQYIEPEQALDEVAPLAKKSKFWR